MADILSSIRLNDTLYWIYKLSDTEWNDYLKFNLEYDNFITTQNDVGISVNDIIIIYVDKDNWCDGFFAITKCKKKYKEGTELDVQVFRNVHYNKYVLKIVPMVIFKRAIKFNELIQYLNKSKVAFKSIGGFKKKFVNTKIPLTVLDMNGKELTENLLRINNEISNKEVVDDNSSSSLEDDSKITEKSVEEKEESSEDSLEGLSEDECGESEDGEDESGEQSEDGICNMPGGCIPICMEKCKNFVWPKKVRNKKLNNTLMNKYFIDHYRTCTLCEKTDSNNIDVMGYLTENNVEVIVIDDGDNDMFVEAYTYHNNDKKYKPSNFTKTPYFRILDVDTKDKHFIHNNSIYIVWSTS